MKPLLAAAMTGLVVSLAACSGSDADQSTHLVVSPSQTGDDVRIAGTVRISTAGCWGIRAGSTTYVAAWPQGTTLDDGHLTVGGQRLDVGDAVVGGGGFYDADSLPANITLPKGCTAGQIAIIDAVERSEG